MTDAPFNDATPFAEIQSSENDPIVHIDKVTKTFGNVYAVDDVSLKIYQGEFFSLLGGSGCGKTTLLRMLAGFEKPTTGRIYLDGQDVTDLPPYERPLNIMLQSYALFPHMTVADNIAFGLKQESMPKALRQERVREMMALVQIEKLANRKPHQLSGGQKQRVALARSLAKHPKILLLDEPLGALDKRLREQTQFELVNIQERLGITFIVVTHDQEEAMTMSSRIALMNEGRVMQVDSPRRLYEYPSSRYSAEFIGSINLFAGTVISQEDNLVLIDCEEAGTQISVQHSQPLVSGMDVTVAVRPEKVRLSSELDKTLAPHAPNQLQGVIKEIAYLGDVSIYHVDLPSGKRVQFTQSNVQALAEQPLNWDDQVNISWQANACSLLVE
ncbi:ABC transporter ATP-binding protein [Thiosulfativibrio zosterae]|uniref:Spermidine/putrescine import ATP-binding protein PotA n=1 Tax=Thiosulfativibrio zosterae TaxID=2675053 RepID=A0A6F8PQQ7_9GAMM|nr:ABC transporter ATP-binding protein [Thiosulfativibrio zosterae]BBP44445.1 polyamine-transporting ATPase [Thiosulfativibrio zosterae]